MKKSNKKLITVALVIMLTVSLIGSAFAGSIFNTIKNAGKTLWNGVKTVGVAIYDTGVYVCTDDDAETAYRSTRKAAGKVKEAACDTADTFMKIGEDAGELLEGSVTVVKGLYDLGGASLKDVINYVTGDGEVSEAGRKAIEEIKGGCQQVGNGLLADVIKLCPGGSLIVAGGNTVINGVEFMAGSIDREEAKERLRNDFIDAAFGAGSYGIGTVTTTVGEKIVTTVVTEVAKALTKKGTE